MNIENNNMWFKQGRFPINLQTESQGEFMDGTNIKVTTFMDTGCSKPILNRKFYNKHPYLHKLPRYRIQSIGVIVPDDVPHYPIQSIGVIVPDDGVIKVTEAI